MEFVPRLRREQQRCRDNPSLHAKHCRRKAPGSQEWLQTRLSPHPGMGMDMIFRGGKEKRREMGSSPGDTSPWSRGATRSRKHWQHEPKASGISDALQTQPRQQDAGWAAGMHSGLAVTCMSSKLVLGLPVAG